MLILAIELCALILSLLLFPGAVLVGLGKISLYLLWAVLAPAAIICWLRNSIRRMPFWQGGALIASIAIASFVLVEVIAQRYVTSGNYHEFDAEQFLSHLVIALIVTGVGLYAMFYSGRVERWSQVQAQAKVQALQSRIRPHFLFNSLNTIAELTATNPSGAEAAIDSLSLLFRASLENVAKAHSLQAEIDLCERYIELERWRMADRLIISKSVAVQGAHNWQVPKLILQPLVENAVVHGVTADGSVNIELDIRETSKYISIMVRNAKGADASERDSNGMAIDNIRERLFVLYDDQQSFKVRDEAEHFQVILRLPKQTHIAFDA